MPSTDIQVEKMLDDCQVFHSFLPTRSPATKKDIVILPLNLLLISSLNPQSVRLGSSGEWGPPVAETECALWSKEPGDPISGSSVKRSCWQPCSPHPAPGTRWLYQKPSTPTGYSMRGTYLFTCISEPSLLPEIGNV